MRTAAGKRHREAAATGGSAAEVGDGGMQGATTAVMEPEPLQQTAEEPGVPRPSEAAEPGEYRMIAVEKLVPTHDNPRILRDDQAFKELIESVRSVGILQPLIARPYPLGSGGQAPGIRDQLYDLRAGHRRLAAAKRAGLAAVPVIVRAMDDRTAMEVTVTENLQRENLTPLEESEGVQHLLDVGWEPREIADRFGKTAGWVARRAKLQALSPAWRKAIADTAMGVSLWNASLLDCIARLPSATQDAVLADVADDGQVPSWQVGRLQGTNVMPTAQQLDAYLSRTHLQILRGAPFKLDDATLSPKAGACTECPKRSGCQPSLFEGLEDAFSAAAGEKKSVEQDRCLDQVCYQSKCRALAHRKCEQLKQEHGKVIPLAKVNLYGDREKKLKKEFPDIQQESNFLKAKARERGAVPAVYVDGAAAGNTTWVKPYGHDGGSRRSGGGKREKGTSTPLAERREALMKRRMAHVIEAVRERIGKLAKMGAGDGRPLSICGPDVAIRLAIAFGTEGRRSSPNETGGNPWSHLNRLRGIPSGMSSSELIGAVLPVLRMRLTFFNGDGAKRLYPECKRIAALILEDFKALEKAAAEAIPEPAGWAVLKADGTQKKKTGAGGQGSGTGKPTVNRDPKGSASGGRRAKGQKSAKGKKDTNGAAARTKPAGPPTNDPKTGVPIAYPTEADSGPVLTPQPKAEGKTARAPWGKTKKPKAKNKRQRAAV